VGEAERQVVAHTLLPSHEGPPDDGSAFAGAPGTAPRVEADR
jgi:hypothetical protein